VCSTLGTNPIPDISDLSEDSDVEVKEQTSKGATMTSHNLQLSYVAAMGKIGAIQNSSSAKKHTPIFQRNGGISQEQAVKDAAVVLRALWTGRMDKQ
jgi:hypothetical protein